MGKPASRSRSRRAHVPNQVPLRERIGYGILAACLIGYGGYGLATNDVALPGRRGHVTHLHDVPALLMVGALACGALLALSVIVDHYDERDNEHRYRAFARHARRLGFALFFAALAWDLVARLGAPDG
ncbi:MAG: hypothetical protein KDH20_01795 [Rhodocyclaceae bacterium]|nr:hypothetical protein [Rhodocyclaceae bacterium]